MISVEQPAITLLEVLNVPAILDTLEMDLSAQVK